MTDASILVPRRSDRGWRDLLWRFCRARWERQYPTIPIIEGFDAGVGPFNRAAAINDARRHATASTFVIIDADVFTHDGVLGPIIAAAQGGRFTVGFDDYRALTEDATQKVLDGWVDGWTEGVEQTLHDAVSKLVVVTAGLFDRVGGFDERFSGWGWEDVAFALACDAIAGPRVVISNDVWHLWHPPARFAPEEPVNKSLAQDYIAAPTSEAMDALIRRRHLR